ncbi:MAG: hypothetical protein JWM86_1006 [Thermoleophilia bacterium]|nr:hypothetical protein [Thermoleophilia bacterium]
MHHEHYAHPRELTEFALERWPCAQPAEGQLERLYATCYQASLLSEEGRPITFRAILADPEVFDADGGPPHSFHRLDLQRPIRFEPRELRRLSAAADYRRTLIGVQADGDGVLHIWGLVDQGVRWLHDVVGGRGGGPALPSVPIVHVVAPGSLEARCGSALVARLESGRLSGTRFDVFDATWLHDDFLPLQDAVNRRHELARDAAEARGEQWARPEHGIARLIGEQMVKRVVALIRQGRHGGTLLFVPDEATVGGDANGFLDIKYPFADTSARRRFFDLLADILDAVAEIRGGDGGGVYSWADFQATVDERLAALDEAWFELANLIAGLASVDGAVVLGRHMEIVGFGAEILGQLPPVRSVHRALDLDANSVSEEPAASEGTRHRSAYRLASALPGALAIVVSQDGGARFVKDRDGAVTIWDHE